MSFSELKYQLLRIAAIALIIGLPVVAVGVAFVPVATYGSSIDRIGVIFLTAAVIVMVAAYVALAVATGLRFFKEDSKRSVVKPLFAAAMELTRVAPHSTLTADRVPRRSGGFLRFQLYEGDVFHIEDIPQVDKGFARSFTLNKRGITDLAHPEQLISPSYLRGMTSNLLGYAAIGMDARIDPVDTLPENTYHMDELIPESEKA